MNPLVFAYNHDSFDHSFSHSVSQSVSQSSLLPRCVSRCMQHRMDCWCCWWWWRSRWRRRCMRAGWWAVSTKYYIAYVHCSLPNAEEIGRFEEVLRFIVF